MGQFSIPTPTISVNPPSDEEVKPQPQSPDPYDLKVEDNVQRIKNRFEKRLQIDGVYRTYFEREWFRNVLYYAGKQWIIFDNTTRRWRPKRLPEWFPTPITNKFAEKVNDLVAALLGGRPPINYFPATDDPEDAATAEIGERVREVFYEEADVDEWEDEVATWIVLTGNAFVVPYYDDSPEFGVVNVPMQQCVACGNRMTPLEVQNNEGACPQCAATGQPSAGLMPAANPMTGEPVTQQYPVGAMRSEVVSPFEIRIDPRVRSPRKRRWFMRLNTYSLEEAKQMWKNETDVTKLTADKEQGLSQIYLDALAYLTSSFGSASSLGASGGTASTDAKFPRTTAYELYELPSDDFPEGLYAIRVGKLGPVVKAQPLDTRYGAGPRKGQCFLPLVQFGFDLVPGRTWRKTRVDDLISLQSYRNLIDAVIKLTVQRTGGPAWLNPTGSGMENITGEPGQIFSYTPISLGGQTFAKPERIPAELNNLPPLIGLLNKIDDAMERIAGTFFLQGGDTPPGVTAASALAYLGERAQRAMSPLKRSYVKSWKHWEEICLEIFRAHVVDTRIRVIAGRNTKWKVEKFVGSELKGAVDMRIDYEAMFPKSQATLRATIAQLIQLGVLQPQDPEQQYKILEAFGETRLKGSESIDVEEAVKEWDNFLVKGTMPVIIPIVQNDMIHIKEHGNAAKTDEFMELNPQQQQQWIDHINLHLHNLMARQAAFSGSPNPNAPTPDGSEGGSTQPGSQKGTQANTQRGTQMTAGHTGLNVPEPIAKGQARAATEGSATPAVHTPTPSGTNQ